MGSPLIRQFIVAATVFGLAGCATAPHTDRERMVGIPLASSYSDIAFTITTGSKLDVVCDKNEACSTPVDRDTTRRFVLKVRRITRALQKGAQHLYPDLAQRVPGLVDSRFDVYVVVGTEPGATSSANGRIALNAALGAWQGYDVLLAFVIAREMGHVIARHAEENSSVSIATSVILNILLPGSGLLKSAISMGGSEIAAKKNLDIQAQEADAIAFSLLGAAGFPVQDVSRVLLTAPVLLDDGAWSRKFRKSSSNLIATARGSSPPVGHLQ